MRYLKLDKIPVGSKLGKDILYNERQVLLKEGAILTDGIISKLKEKGFNYIYVDDELSKGIEIEENVPQHLKDSILAALNKMDVEQTMEAATELTERIYESSNISVEHYNLDPKKEHEHATLVAELSIALGKAIGYNQSKLNELATAALFHDVGKALVDKKEMEEFGVDKLLKRLGLDCSMDEYRDSVHSFLGYSILNKDVIASAMIKQAVLFHHENIDGTGDLKIPGEKICEFAKIIHITNDFSRLITEAEKYNISNTNEVIEYLKAKSGTIYDSRLVDIFLSKIPLYPSGMTVELSNGMEAIVIENNHSFPSRPKIMLENGMKIDLLNPSFQSLAIKGINLRNSNKEKQL